MDEWWDTLESPLYVVSSSGVHNCVQLSVRGGMMVIKGEEWDAFKSSHVNEFNHPTHVLFEDIDDPLFRFRVRFISPYGMEIRPHWIDDDRQVPIRFCIPFTGEYCYDRVVSF